MYALGIDLGTTFTAAAVWRDGRAEISSLGSRSAAIPSVVVLRDDETIVTGETASRRALTSPHRVAREFKRRLGDTTPILLAGVPYSAESLMARMLRSVVEEVSAREGGAPSSVCVSHPANWGPYKTDLLRQAVRSADLDDAMFTTEPEAAAVFYAQQQRIPDGAVVAVYDLGGGTFDAAVLRKTAAGFEILGRPEGIERLGGIDIDAAVFAHVARSLNGALEQLDEDDPATISAVGRLREECTEAKEALSSDTDTTIPVLLPNLVTEVRLTRGELESMVRPALQDSIDALRRALRSAGVEAEDLHSVLLVGGSSRMPIVAQLVGAELGRPVAVDVHPKHAVALGAAWLAGGLTSSLTSADASQTGPAEPVRSGQPAASTGPAEPLTQIVPPPGHSRTEVLGRPVDDDPFPASSGGSSSRGSAAGRRATGSATVDSSAAQASTTAAQASTTGAQASTSAAQASTARASGSQAPGGQWAADPVPSEWGARSALPGFPPGGGPGGAGGGAADDGDFWQPAPTGSQPAVGSRIPPGSGGRSRGKVFGAAIAVLLVIGLGAAGAYALSRQGDDATPGASATTGKGKPTATTPASTTATTASNGATVSADEQCSTAIKANPRWVCLTSATFDQGTLTINYKSSFDGSTPNSRTGYHLNIYGGDGVNPPDSTEGRQSMTPGHWYAEDQNPSVLKDTSANYKTAIGSQPKVCARIANKNGQLVQDKKGTFVTGNCVTIRKI